MPVIPRPLLDRFWERVNKTEGGCWLWSGSRHKSGYGKLKVNGKYSPAHRLSYQFHFGEIPTGLFVCHHCDVRRCVNPLHLFLGTSKDNMIDAAKKGRLALGERVGGKRKLTAKDVMNIREQYLEGGLAQHEIAKRFHVTRQHVGYIVARKSWRWL